MNAKTVEVPNISCNHCVATIKRELAEIAGVKTVEGDPQAKKVTVGWIEPASWDRIAAALAEIGYPVKESS